MVEMKGYGDKFLRVDLSSGDVKVEDVPPEFPAKYLGGIGFASRILYDEVEHVDPLKPENKLVIVPGLLVGTGIPTASKTVFVARSPLTRGFGRAVAGASLGVDMRKAGYESIVIEGASEEAVVLNIDDGEVAIEDGSDLWGMDVRKAAGRLRDRYGKVSTAVIGPAGERLSLIADIDCDERQAGRTGLGAVLGSKRLKGICVRGTGRVEYADP
ncbi:MAG: aldehyde:ferredoxin oxidoreductase, partial [Nitrososphaeria archaeon]|nr:aldehyde:ferredoxin oxidoreductase [Nitrososphaeria archaeon]NIQ33060.1 aldehyde:ferredoxin oxidoreductase [Nitrososphaeria archaeon]